MGMGSKSPYILILYLYTFLSQYHIEHHFLQLGNDLVGHILQQHKHFVVFDGLQKFVNGLAISKITPF